MSDSPLASRVMLSPSNSGTGYAKTFGVIHDIECPPGPSWAESLGGPDYMQNRANGVSVHYIVDSDSVVQTATESTWCWGAGKYANRRSIQIEQAGYASFTIAQWTGASSAVGSTYQRPDGSRHTFTASDAADMAAQFDLLARLIADISKRRGWKAERATADELRRASNGENVGKWCRHVDVSDDLGGTVHRDTGKGLPFDDLLARARHYMAPKPAPILPAPLTTQEDDMSQQIIRTTTSSGKFVYATLGTEGVEWISKGNVLTLLRATGSKEYPVSREVYNACRAPGTNEVN